MFARVFSVNFWHFFGGNMKIIVIVILPEDLSQICLDKISTKYFKTCRQNCNKGWVVWSLFIKSFHVTPQKSVKSGHWPSECSLTCLLCYCIISHQKLFFEERTNDQPSQDHIIPPLESLEEEREKSDHLSFLPSLLTSAPKCSLWQPTTVMKWSWWGWIFWQGIISK